MKGSIEMTLGVEEDGSQQDAAGCGLGTETWEVAGEGSFRRGKEGRPCKGRARGPRDAGRSLRVLGRAVGALVLESRGGRMGLGLVGPEGALGAVRAEWRLTAVSWGTAPGLCSADRLARLWRVF